MKIFLLGYGQMGKEIEKLALNRGHDIAGIYDPYSEHNVFNKKDFENADAAIEFSTPGSTIYNMIRCFESGVPVVVGTTGWYEEFDQIKEQCNKLNGTLFYATNFSIGVNILFRLADYLSDFMKGHHGYDVAIHEVHHTKKKDAPSGTAITLADKILKNHQHLKSWYELEEGTKQQEDASQLPIFYDRVEDVVGQHEIVYKSGIDQLSIKHEAYSREGFATGTLIATEWVLGKKGIFTMSDILDR